MHDLPGVGENLQDHLQLRLIFKCTKPITTNDDLASPWRSAKIGLQWLLRRTGPLAVGINQGGLFTRVLPESTTPDIQFHFATLSADLAGAKPHPFSGFTMSVCQLRPTSRGHVRIKSADPLARAGDAAQLPFDRGGPALRGRGRQVRAPARRDRAMRPYVGEEYRPGAAATSDADLLEFAREYGATIFHPSGTCKMGSDALAVVDDRLRVHGVAGLRVVDCSIMPTLVSGNTNAPVVMIAEKASDLILADARAVRGPGWPLVCYPIQRSAQVGLQVGDILDADRQAHQRSPMPSRARCSAGIDACVMIAGCSIRLSTPPRLSASAKSRSARGSAGAGEAGLEIERNHAAERRASAAWPARAADGDGRPG